MIEWYRWQSFIHFKQMKQVSTIPMLFQGPYTQAINSFFIRHWHFFNPGNILVNRYWILSIQFQALSLEMCGDQAEMQYYGIAYRYVRQFLEHWIQRAISIIWFKPKTNNISQYLYNPDSDVYDFELISDWILVLCGRIGALRDQLTTGHTDPVKSWNLKFKFSRPGKPWN